MEFQERTNKEKVEIYILDKVDKAQIYAKLVDKNSIDISSLTVTTTFTCGCGNKIIICGRNIQHTVFALIESHDWHGSILGEGVDYKLKCEACSAREIVLQ